MSLYINQTNLDRLLEEAREAFPEECCGLLVGRRDGADMHVERIVRAANIAEGDKTTNYQVDWATLFETIRQARFDKDTIVGFYHSHPDGSTKPSIKDTESAWIDHAYVIIPSGRHERTSPTSWRIRTGTEQFEPERIVVP